MSLKIFMAKFRLSQVEWVYLMVCPTWKGKKRNLSDLENQPETVYKVSVNQNMSVSSQLTKVTSNIT